MYLEDRIARMTEGMARLETEFRSLRSTCEGLARRIEERERREAPPAPVKPRERMNVKELAELTGKSAYVIRQMCREHRIPHYRTGGDRIFFLRDEVLRCEEIQGIRIATDKEVDRKAAIHMANLAIAKVFPNQSLTE